MAIGTIIPQAHADHDDSMDYYKKAQEAYIRRDLNASESLLKKSISADSRNEHAYTLLAEVLYLKQDAGAAIVALGKAIQINPRLSAVKSRLEQIKRENAVESRLEKSTQGVFDIRFAGYGLRDTGAPLPDARYPIPDIDSIKSYLQEAYETLGKQFDYYPQHPVIVLLYPEEDFYRLTKLPIGVTGAFDGKVRLPLPDTRAPYPEFKATLWHEYAHAIIYDLSGGKAPLWLHEGIATFEGSLVRPQDCSALKKAIETGRIFPLEFLFNPIGPRGEGVSFNAGLFYQESYSLVKYIMLIWGAGRIKRMLAEFGKGADYRSAVKAVLGKDIAVLEKDWLSWAKGEMS